MNFACIADTANRNDQCCIGNNYYYSRRYIQNKSLNIMTHDKKLFS